MKHRLERVNEVIKRELSEIISREIDFSAQVLVTVQAVDTTADLRHCDVFVSAIGKEEKRSRVLNELDEHRTTLQQELARRVVLKYTPQLHFKLDSSIERGSRVLDIMRRLEEPPGDSE
jgi:ribosome-binding factor A